MGFNPGKAVCKAVKKHVVKPVKKHVVKPAKKHVAAPVIAAAAAAAVAIHHVVEPVVQPVVHHVVTPVVQHVVEPVVAPVVQHVVEPVVAPVVQHVVTPVVKHTIEPVVKHAVEPIMKAAAKDVPVVPKFDPMSLIPFGNSGGDGSTVHAQTPDGCMKGCDFARDFVMRVQCDLLDLDDNQKAKCLSEAMRAFKNCVNFCR